MDESMTRTHGVDHYDPNCFGCKVLDVNISPSAMPTRHPVAAGAKKVGQGWERDLPAYRALRREGLQPKSVDGAADLQAQACTAAQIEGRPDEKMVERVLDAVA